MSQFAVSRVRLRVPASKAKPAPSIGQPLTAMGINMAKFCKEFNARTTEFIDGLPMMVKVTSFSDKSYQFTVHPPRASYFLKKAARVHLCTSQPGRQIVGNPIHVKQLYEIAKLKHSDPEHTQLNSTTLKGVFKSIIASCHHYGFAVDWRREDEIQASIEKRRKELQSKQVEEKVAPVENQRKPVPNQTVLAQELRISALKVKKKKLKEERLKMLKTRKEEIFRRRDQLRAEQIAKSDYVSGTGPNEE